jgi:hypothetical protein
MGFSLVFSVLSFSFFFFLPSIFLPLFAPAELCWALDTGSPGNRRNAKDAKDNREKLSVNACLSCLVLSCLSSIGMISGSPAALYGLKLL